jgi:hypothetical protein
MNAPTNSLPAKAQYKCWVVWQGPTADIKKTFYSYDSSGRYDVEKPDEYGLKGLQKRVVRQYPEKMKRAIIYDNQTGTKLFELQNGQWVDAQS